MPVGPNPVKITPPASSQVPTLAPLLIGVATPNQTLSEVTTLESTLGQQIAVYRSYDSGFPATWQAGAGNWVPDRIVSWHSVKPSIANTASGALDSQITAWAQSIPLSHKCILTFQHEMENPSKGNNPTQFRTAFARFYDLVKAVRPDFQIGPVYMSWTFNPQSGRNPDDWWPGDTHADFIGVDTYEIYLDPTFGAPTTWAPGPEKAYTTAIAYGQSHGVPPAVGEFAAGWGPPASGSKGTDHAAKVAWIKATVDATAAANGLAVAYFNRNPTTGDIGMLIEEDTETTSYFADVLADPPQVQTK